MQHSLTYLFRIRNLVIEQVLQASSNFLLLHALKTKRTEAVAQSCFMQKVFYLQNSLENTFVGVSF